MPYLSTSVAEALLMVDIAVLIYFIHHIAKSIQLPEVIAGIAGDLIKSIDAEFPDAVGAVVEPAERPHAGKSVPELLKLIDERGAAVPSQVSGYIQYVGYSQLIGIATRTDSVIRLEHRPGPLLGHRPSSRHRLASRSGSRGRPGTVQGPRDGAAPHARAGPRVRHRPVRRDRHQGPFGCRQRHLHRPDLHRLVIGGSGAGLRSGSSTRASIAMRQATSAWSSPTRRTRAW